jgi:hypothetical protein
MLQEICDIWDKHRLGHTVCITTNGYIRGNGFAVMGRGVAKQAKQIIPDIERRLGFSIRKNGNVVQTIALRIISFPVKPKEGVCNFDGSNVVKHMRGKFTRGLIVPGWAMIASIELIEQSLWQLYLGHIHKPDVKIYLPKPGCSAGGLLWEQVKPLCQGYGDWLVICDLK